jgi:polar amino acid transport system substrate-binding protein
MQNIVFRLAMLAILASTGTAGATSLADIKARGYLVVAVPPGTAPFASVENGHPSGFDLDLLEAFGRSAGLRIRPKPVPANRLLGEVRSGDADLAAGGIEINAERQKTVGFGPPVAEVTRVVLARKDKTGHRTLEELSGRPLGVEDTAANALAETELEHLLVKAGFRLGSIAEYDTEDEAEQALAQHRIDYVMGGIATLAASVKAHPSSFELGVTVGHRAWAGWAMAKDAGELQALVAGFIDRSRGDGTLSRLQQSRFGRTFEDLPESVTAVNWWISRPDKPPAFPIQPIKDPD